MEDQRLLEHILDGAKDPTNLSFALLQDITDNFSEERKIGQGGFGAVYKGLLGERTVAVKRIHINVNTVDDKLFHREATILMNINHRNVVRFLGVCSQGYQKPIDKDGSGKYIWADVLERLLCFEYIRNGSLDKHITDELRGLEWEARYEIITGICKGLRYLHTERKITHMDLKPENILLDNQDEKYMVPKITDFGLSRPNENSHTVGKVYGTRGYWAPEYRDDSQTTPACDIYSLGLIIQELVTGCKDMHDKNNVLRRWRHRWGKPPTQLRFQQVTRCMEIAGRCRAELPEARPSISTIISFLSESESTRCQISPFLYEDDMLRINPLELRLPSELKNNISYSVELTNDTLNCIAFNIQPPSVNYITQPVKGTVQPKSKCYVNITVQPGDVRERERADKFIVQSKKLSEGLREEDITEHMSHAEARKVVDEVELMVVYEPTKPLKNFNPREDTKIPAEEVPQGKKRKIAESASEKVKNKPDNSENAEATTMVISSSARGQCIKQLDRHNFHPPENFSHSYPTNMTYLLRDSDRAIDVTRGAMGSLLHKLGELLKDEFNLEENVKEDVKSLSKELMKIQKVLSRMSTLQQTNLDDMVKRWASNVREMSYDLEDFVDGFLVHSEPDSNGSTLTELTHEMCFLLDKGNHQPIADLIKHHISKQVQDEAQQHKEYNVENAVANATSKADIVERRVLALYEDKELLIGIEMPRDELRRLLTEDGNAPKETLRVVSIVGMGGLGKTTLANAVYQNLKAQYDHKTLVSVGQNPDVKKLLTKIICKLNKKIDAANLDMDELIETLREFLEEKRYFIVIDDIWDLEAWDVIRYAFPKNNLGSRVITTTRIERVALACCHPESKYIYRIKPLSIEDSRSLFLGRIFGPGNDCPDAQKDISIDILKKCGGMPLAINSIASLLAGQPRSTWDYVRKTLGAIVEENPAIGNMKQILDLSYMHLPDHLKTCLLHICKYEEDEEIDKNDLLRQWVAEGFVLSKHGRLDAEDVAENYFKALINMCLIQPGKIDYNNEVLSCRVHDIILELIRTKSSEENFIHVVDGSKDARGTTGLIRRFTVHGNFKVDSRPLTTNKGFVPQCSHVRSVYLYRVSPLAPYFLVFKYIRVLHLKDIQCNIRFGESEVDLTGISRLFLLRYLKVEAVQVGPISSPLKLPDRIGELQQLETIDLDARGLTNYPSDIVSLPRLSHLRYALGVALPDGIERLKSLRTLEGVCYHGSTIDNIKGLSKLTNLTKLQFRTPFVEFGKRREIDVNAVIDALHSCISNLSPSLRILILGEEYGAVKLTVLSWSKAALFPRGSHIRELDLQSCIFQRCPNWIGQLHHLCNLSIRAREVADGLAIVGGLPSLAYFSLKVCDNFQEEKEESVVISGSGAFQALKHLHFYCQRASLTFEEGALPNLEKLDILFRFRMRRRFLPVGIHNLPAPRLKKISLIVSIDYNDWKVKGSEHWTDKNWQMYNFSLHYLNLLNEHQRKLRSMLKTAFKPHHPTAGIYIHLQHDKDNSDPFGVDDKEDDQEEGDAQHDEDDYDDKTFALICGW